MPTARPIIRVPLGLVLSHTLPSCSPAACAAPALQPLLWDASAGWELHLAGLLLWACTPDTPKPGMGAAAAAAAAVTPLPQERRFWQQYARVLPPLEQQTSLLLFEEGELGELQVRGFRAAGTRPRRLLSPSQGQPRVSSHETRPKF
jgi:hypothetical protein